jgi:hypothetical protein
MVHLQQQNFNRYHMSKFILLYLLLFPGFVKGQQYFGKTQSQVKKELQQYIKKNKSLGATLEQTDSTIHMSVPGPASQPADFFYSFDKTGKCVSQKTVTYCDSCFRKFLQALLQQEKYKWKKINENQYISSYSESLLIELPAEEKQYWFLLMKVSWTKELYKLLTGRDE